MVTDTRLSELVNTFGRDHAQAAWDAGLAAISQIESNVRELSIDCDFDWVPGYLHAPTDPSRQKEDVDFQEESKLASELGFDAEFVNDVPLVGGAGIRFDNQARFHPRKYLAGLARAIVAGGGRIYEHTEAGRFLRRARSASAPTVTP
jgi:glycine/D-amino acid oxidase-like deaminating enzyme